MKTKKLLALLVAILMIITCFASCRPKDENALTYNYNGKTINIRTALYMCYLMEADMMFQSQAEAEASESGTEYEDYKDLKYENKDYATWTKDEAKKLVDEHVYYTYEFERLGIAEDIASEQSYIDDNCEQTWESVKDIYEANGVSLETFKEYFACTTAFGTYGNDSLNNYKKELVYSFYTAEKTEEDHNHEEETSTETTTKKVDPEIEKLQGSLRPSSKEINSALKKNFVPVQMIELSLLDDNGEALDEDTKNSYLKILKGYKKDLEGGKAFDKVFEAADEEFMLSAAATSETGETTEATYDAVLYGKAVKQAYGSDEDADQNFTDAYKMKVDEVKIFENDDNLRLIVRKDVLSGKDSQDSSYKDQLTSTAVDVLVKEVFQKEYVEKAVKAMKIEANNSAINYYSPDKIEYPTSETVAQTSYAAY